MYLLGYSLDNLSLMALTLSVGFVVDDAIVMLENIVRHMEMGKPPLQAALDGSREIGFTIVSMTLSLVAVFIPMLFMGGIVGRLFHEFAVTIGVGHPGLGRRLADADADALQPLPALRSATPRHGRAYAVPSSASTSASSGLRAEPGLGDGPPRAALAFSLVILVGTVVLFLRRPQGLHPQRGHRPALGITEAAEGTSFEAMVQHQQAVAAVVARDPNVDCFMSSVGGGGGASGPTRDGCSSG